MAVTTRTGDAPEGFFGVPARSPTRSRSTAAFTAVEEQQGPVEVLVANAGITRDTLLLRMSRGGLGRVIDTNLTGSFRVAKRAAKGMLRLRAGPDHLRLVGGRRCSARPAR